MNEGAGATDDDRALVRRTGRFAAGFLLLVVLTRVLGRALGVEIPLTPGLVLALGLLWGPVVAAGAAIASVLADVLAGTFGRWTAVAVLQHLLLVGLAIRLWGAFGRLSTGRSPAALARSPTSPGASPSVRAIGRATLEYALVVLTVAAIVASATALTARLLGLATVPAVVPDVAGDVLASSLTVGLLALVVAPAIAERADWSIPAVEARAYVEERALVGDRWFAAGGWSLLIGLGWSVGGVATGLVFHGVDLESSDVLVNRVGRTVTSALLAAGRGGIRLQVLIGLASAGLLLLVLRRRPIAPSGEEAASPTPSGDDPTPSPSSGE